MTPRPRAYHDRDTQQVRRRNLLVVACCMAMGLAATGAVLLSGSTIAQAQSSSVNALLPLPPGSPAYLKETWRSALTAPMPFGAAPGVIPALLPQSLTDPDPLGTLGSYQLNGPTNTAANAFFQPLGTNGRTCGSCHVPSQGMGVSVDDLRDRFDAYGPRDPVFAPVDGANCPSAVGRNSTNHDPFD